MSESHKSPPRKPATLSNESPVLMKTVSSSRSYQNNFLEDARLAVLRDLGSHIPEVSFEIFMDHLAPPQPDFNIDDTMKSLKSGRSSVLTASDRWRDFQAPKDHNLKEEAAFKPIKDIFTDVVKAVIENSDPKLTDDNRTTDFEQNPNRAPTSAKRRNASRPDGYLLVKGRDPRAVSWADVVLSCEYKRNDGDAELDDDVRKCLWSMQHVMRDDPRHRATFGMTIQNSTTRLWFCCRSSAVVSEAFDFIGEPKKVVRLFAAFAFADKKSLGFDPTIQPAEDDPDQFIITVHPVNDKNPRKFRTKSIISSYGAEPLRGRGTRVFEAIELDKKGIETGSPVVLKDIWIDDDRTREGTILRQLHVAANDKDKKLVEKYFLTHICHGDVQTESDVLDNTEIALMRGLKLTSDGMFKLQREQVAITKKESAPGSEGPRSITRNEAPDSHPKYPHKTHYRIVFKEKGVTLDLVKSLPKVMTILTETVDALQLLRKLGWVHRDVSVSNILSCEGGAKLADLEYAKKVGDVTSHEMRTGTIHFMSIEVAAQEFLFQPPRPGGRLNITDHIQDVRRTTGTQSQTAAAPFSHNYLHDLESLWWVAVWMVFYNHFSNAEGLDDEAPLKLTDAERQLKLAQFLFPSVLKSTDRRDGFQVSFKKRYADLPHHRAVICGYLDGLRENLVLSYRDIESTLPRSIDLNTLNDDIYEDFKEVFSFSKNEYPDIVLALIPDIHAELKRDAKRPRAESESDIRPRKK